ncbi:uncharacterized protein P884DRAFT_16576 [Thermothelomyces heterothallicus CBS 202.75]|uniref:uncharacterized protein n=1 Tax=Thermothelomyces heterothallicus CBS 202.75 TaxID=1149848 RepID=UPI003742CCAB
MIPPEDHSTRRANTAWRVLERDDEQRSNCSCCYPLNSTDTTSSRELTRRVNFACKGRGTARYKRAGEGRKAFWVPKKLQCAGGRELALIRLFCHGVGPVAGVEALPLLAETTSAQPLGTPPRPSSRKGMKCQRIRQELRRHTKASCGEAHSQNIVHAHRELGCADRCCARAVCCPSWKPAEVPSLIGPDAWHPGEEGISRQASAQKRRAHDC